MSTTNPFADRSSKSADKLSRHPSTQRRAPGLLVAGLALLAGLAAGCGDAPSTACDISQSAGSVTARICIEFLELSPSEIEEADTVCMAQNDPPLMAEVVDSCPKDGILGTCELSLGGMTAQEFYYESAAFTTEIAEQNCTDQGGTWKEG